MIFIKDAQGKAIVFLNFLHICVTKDPINYIFLERSWEMLFNRADKILPHPLSGATGQKLIFSSKKWQKMQSYSVKNIFIVFFAPENPHLPKFRFWKIGPRVVHQRVGEIAQKYGL